MDKKANIWVLAVVGVVAVFAISVMLFGSGGATANAVLIPSEHDPLNLKVSCDMKYLPWHANWNPSGTLPVDGETFCRNNGYDACSGVFIDHFDLGFTQGSNCAAQQKKYTDRYTSFAGCKDHLVNFVHNPPPYRCTSRMGMTEDQTVSSHPEAVSCCKLSGSSAPVAQSVGAPQRLPMR